MERRKEKRGWTGIDCVLFGRPLPAANYDRFRYWKQNHGGGLAPRGPEKHFHHDIIPNSGSDLLFASSASRARNTIGLDRIIDIMGHSGLCFRPLSSKEESGLNIVRKKYQEFSTIAEIFLDRIQRDVFPLWKNQRRR